MEKIITKLTNFTELAYKRNPDTPRTALNLTMSLNNQNSKPGVNSLMSRLFMQGTKTRSAEQLAQELDEYAIEFSSEIRPDYLKFKIVCLNEDFQKAVEILTDIVKNTTFADFEKEKIKLAGEISAELDSPRAKLTDCYYKNMYENHPYGYTNTVVLENLDNISKEEVIKSYESILNDSKKVISVVGDLEFDFIKQILEKSFDDLPVSNDISLNLNIAKSKNKKEITIVKEDLNQAHIIKGWLVGGASSADYPTLALLNIILGASGLSSRLFLELRDKKGLAYVVRSSYDTAGLAANFSIYIATEPKNIETSLDGFEKELEKIKNVLVSDEELENAKNNLFGKWAFISETNSQQANWLSHYGVSGLGFDFFSEAQKKVKAVTAEDIQNCAKKYLDDKYVQVILKP